MHEVCLRKKSVLKCPCLHSLVFLTICSGLQKFRKLALMANINHDRMVPYRTAAMCSADPYESTRDWYGTSPSLPAASEPEKYRSIRQPMRDSSQTDLLVEEDQVPVRGKWLGLIVLSLLPILIFVLMTLLIIMVIKVSIHNCCWYWKEWDPLIFLAVYLCLLLKALLKIFTLKWLTFLQWEIMCSWSGVEVDLGTLVMML
jgi:hypothetical protein